MTAEPELRRTAPLRVAGFTTRASYEDASGIGPLWGTFSERASEASFQAAPVAVYHDYTSDFRGEYTLLVGLPLGDGDTAPGGWTTLAIPAADHLVFPVPEGQMPDVVIDTWRRIWDHFTPDCPYERTYTFDSERYGADGIEILVAVRERG